MFCTILLFKIVSVLRSRNNPNYPFFLELGAMGDKSIAGHQENYDNGQKDGVDDKENDNDDQLDEADDHKDDNEPTVNEKTMDMAKSFSELNARDAKKNPLLQKSPKLGIEVGAK